MTGLESARHASTSAMAWVVLWNRTGGPVALALTGWHLRTRLGGSWSPAWSATGGGSGDG
jgi:hypothetical protein